MGFYMRKSLKAGPFRFNFSQKGVGFSVGTSLFRVGVGPRGNYIRIGAGGFSYKTTLPAEKKTPLPIRLEDETVVTPSSTVEMKEIESADVLSFQDSSSADLLSEMNMKFKKASMQPFFTTLLIIDLIVFLLNYPSLLYLIPIPFISVGVYWAGLRDKREKTVILFYELDDTTEKAYCYLHDAFEELRSCDKKWHIASSGNVTNLAERKRQAGADTLVNRNPTTLSLTAPPFVSTNIAVPGIMVGKQVLYFFPDRVFIYQKGHGVGAFSYSDIQLQITNTNFIESESVPNDTKIIDYTWKYVNKKGGPDKRYKDNKEIPICLYSEFYFYSSSGLNEVIQLSKPGIGTSFAEALNKMTQIAK